MANEKRLVAYDSVAFGEFTQSLINSLEVYDSYSDGYEDGVGRIEDWLEFNYVDAVEVVHGRWEIITDDYDCEMMCCSVCREEFYDGDNDTVDCLHNYCPHCGAKMDGDGNA